MENDKLNPVAPATPRLPIGWLILFFALLILMLVMFYGGIGSSTYRSQRDIDAEKCAGLSGPECLEKLSLERRRREFVESPEGREFLRAAEATGN